VLGGRTPNKVIPFVMDKVSSRGITMIGHLLCGHTAAGIDDTVGHIGPQYFLDLFIGRAVFKANGMSSAK
jgi:hypothetical protein